MESRGGSILARAEVLVFTTLRLTPIVAQGFNETELILKMHITSTSENGEFSFTSVIITADGKNVAILDQVQWDASETAAIGDPNLIRLLGHSKEAYITIPVPDFQPPFNRMSFKLSADQLADCLMMADKYDALKRQHY